VPLQSTIFTIVLVAVACAYGFWKLHTSVTDTKGLTVGVVQGNIEQDVKWDKGFQKETLEIYGELSAKLSKTSPRLIIWPETAVPAYFPSGTGLDQKVMAIPHRLKAYLLFGSLSSRKQGEEVKIYNSAFLISPRPRIVNRYDKMHLVPFGEYVPLSSFFPFFNSLVGIGNITPGEKAVVFQFPRGTFGTLICFEVIFPELCRKFVRNGADFMVTITNDAWFGRTSAPYQHLAQATFRSIENRIWLVRAANTGISAFVDPWGRITTASGLFTREVLTGEINLRGSKMTFYTLYGDVFAIFCSLLGICLIGYVVLRKQVVW